MPLINALKKIGKPVFIVNSESHLNNDNYVRAYVPLKNWVLWNKNKIDSCISLQLLGNSIHKMWTVFQILKQCLSLLRKTWPQHSSLCSWGFVVRGQGFGAQSTGIWTHMQLRQRRLRPPGPGQSALYFTYSTELDRGFITEERP